MGVNFLSANVDLSPWRLLKARGMGGCERYVSLLTSDVIDCGVVCVEMFAGRCQYCFYPELRG